MAMALLMVNWNGIAPAGVDDQAPVMVVENDLVSAPEFGPEGSFVLAEDIVIDQVEEIPISTEMDPEVPYATTVEHVRNFVSSQMNFAITR